MAGHGERVHKARLGSRAALLGLALRGLVCDRAERGRQLGALALPAADGRHVNAGGERGLAERCAGLAGCQQPRDNSLTVGALFERGGGKSCHVPRTNSQ